MRAKSAARSLVLACALAALALPAWAQRGGALAPGPGFFPNTAKGERLFKQNCAVCHGENLRGTDKGPPLIHPVYKPDHHGDVAFQLAVRNGSRQHHWNFGDMQPVPGLTAEDVGHITAYVRREQRKAGLF
ncbi:MAG: c-type cytochrome [Burkholderiales bacterium]|nr:c-type cytochrome [Burkholderiales bacterium]